jgi:hypothetical protein
MTWLALALPLALTEAFLPERALALSGRGRLLRMPLLCLGLIAAAGPTVLLFEVMYLRAGLIFGLLTVPLTLPAAIALLLWRISYWVFEDGGDGMGDWSDDEPGPEPPWWPEFEEQLSRYVHERTSSTRVAVDMSPSDVAHLAQNGPRQPLSGKWSPATIAPRFRRSP